jgi:hypothetical protein
MLVFILKHEHNLSWLQKCYNLKKQQIVKFNYKKGMPNRILVNYK